MIRTKQKTAPPPDGDPLEFLMSDGSVDRMGDVIEPDGWKLDNFRMNPIALFSHDATFPIGKWQDVGIKGGRLVGRLDLMEPVSDRQREIKAAVDAGVLRAVSVGFHANKYEPLEGSTSGGLHFIEQELVECSLVSVPANPNTLALAKSLGLSSETRELIFGVPAEENQPAASRRPVGVPAGTDTFFRKHQPMNQLSERIETKQTELVAMRDQLTSILDTDDAAKMTDLTARIEEAQNLIATWERAEKALGNTSTTAINIPASRTTVFPPGSGLPSSAGPKAWAMPKKKDEEPGYLFLRHCVCKYLSHVTKRSYDQVMTERYGSYGDFEVTRELGQIYTRAATAPATTTTTGWAAELARVQYGEFFDILLPAGIYAPLSAKGFRATLGNAATLSMPTRSSTPAVSGSFIAEGAPIPVRQAAFTPVTIGLKKMGIIVSYTREIAEHSTPQIEQLLRQLIVEDTQVAVDTTLIDINAATAIRPAGLRSGVAGLTPTAGGGFAALLGDIKQLIAVLSAANALVVPVWIMNPQQAISISLTMNAGGFFPFKQEIDNNMLQGYPVILSNTMPLGTVLIMNADDFMSVTGDEPRFDVSDQATLHFEDTTPLQLATGPQGTAVVATPQRNMFQTDSIALRMVLPMNWAMRRTGVIAWVAGVTW